MNDELDVGKLTGLPDVTKAIRYQHLEGKKARIRKAARSVPSSGGYNVSGTIASEYYWEPVVVRKVDYERNKLVVRSPETSNDTDVPMNIIQEVRTFPEGTVIILKDAIEWGP